MDEKRSLTGQSWGAEKKKRGSQCEACMEAVEQNFALKKEIGLNQRSKYFQKFEGFVLGLERTLGAFLI